MAAHAFSTLPFWLAVAGAATAWILYILRPELPAKLRRQWGFMVTDPDGEIRPRPFQRLVLCRRLARAGHGPVEGR